MKIKRKVQKNLPQLIEWAWGNDVRNRNIRADQDISAVFINEFGDVYTTDEVKRDYTFKVEVEEVVTEKTKFELMIEITDSYPNCLWEEASVEDWKDEDSKEFHAYIDGEFKLIWTHEKGLVE